MPPVLNYPGVYIEELPSAVHNCSRQAQPRVELAQRRREAGRRLPNVVLANPCAASSDLADHP
jgi:hypothetical protein